MTGSRILIVFYGIGRGGKLSFESYKRSLIEPLQSLGYSINTIHILKKIEELNSSRTGEFGRHTPYSLQFSESSKVIRVSAGDLRDSGVYEYSKKFKDKHLDNYQSNQNLVHQLLKLQLAARLVHFEEYNRVVLIRDDLVFLNERVDWPSVMALSKTTPVVSRWFWNAGISERFVVASPRHASVLANRIEEAIPSIDHLGFLNGEVLMQFVVDRSDFEVAVLDIRFARVRLNQRVQKERFLTAIWRPNEVFRVYRATVITWWRLCKIRVGSLLGPAKKKRNQ